MRFQSAAAAFGAAAPNQDRSTLVHGRINAAFYLPHPIRTISIEVTTMQRQAFISACQDQGVLLAGKEVVKRPSISVLAAFRAGRLRLTAAAAIALALTVIPSSATATSGTLIITSNTTLTEDHQGNIHIAADNVTLDCANHTVFGPGVPGFSGGIDVAGGLTGVTVKRCNVTGFDDVNGVFGGGGASNGRYEANTLYGNGNHGMHLDSGSGYVVVGNTSRDNGAIGIVLTGATQSRIAGNAVVSNPNWAGIALFDGSHDNIVAGNIASRNALGILLENNSFDNELSDNTATSNGQGFALFQGAADNILESNTANRNDTGFAIADSSGNLIRSNVANRNATHGFELIRSNSNMLTANTANSNGAIGFLASEGSSFNRFSRNLARGNGNVDAMDDGSGTGNVWTNNNFGTTSGI